MGTNEITISEFQLEDCGKNIKKLEESWAAMPTLNCNIFARRSGYSVLAVERCLGNATAIPNSMQGLLVNTDAFLSNLRDSFARSDAKAAERIDQLVE